MHHRLGPVFAQYLVEADFVENVAFLQPAPTDSPFMPMDEIVIGNRRVAGRCERLARVGPDIAGAARNQYMSRQDRKSTRLNSSHSQISYAVFCLKKKKQNKCIKHRHTSHYY